MRKFISIFTKAHRKSDPINGMGFSEFLFRDTPGQQRGLGHAGFFLHSREYLGQAEEAREDPKGCGP